MTINKIKQVRERGQSIWIDLLDRTILRTGQLKQFIEDGISGVTSNPAIFEKAFSAGTDYDDDIRALAPNTASNEELFFDVVIKDIRQVADILKEVYEREPLSGDGYVSLEVSPLRALDTAATFEQAVDLWHKIDRPNAMIKIPGTRAGLPAIRQAIREGINVNVTLLFSLDSYRKVAEAYIMGLDDALATGKDIDGIASVASFFLSRIDVAIDPMLDEKGFPELKGQVAIACARQAYEIYKQIFSGERWSKLAAYGAKPQRLLWASTGSKDPAYKDTKYVEALIGPDTVDTIPLETLQAFQDHGLVLSTFVTASDHSACILKKLENAGIDLREVTKQLEEEGIEKFKKPFEKLLEAIETIKTGEKVAV